MLCRREEGLQRFHASQEVENAGICIADEGDGGTTGGGGGGGCRTLLDNPQRSISECYMLVLPENECMPPGYSRKNTTHNGGDIQQHLQSMFYLLRPEDTLKMAVKLESIHVGRTRYLVVVSCNGRQSTEESCLLGIDCNDKATTGLVLPVWADTQITLDGDGGFSVSSSGRHHIFKPVSVQAMWSALQTLHKAGAKARVYNYFMGGLTHSWIEYYEQRIQSDRSCLNEWHAMDDLESRRPPSPDSLRCRPEREATEQYIRVKLKEIMMSVDLDEVTSKYIRSRLEEDMSMTLHEYKSFIDQEMIVILGQMDAATQIFDHLYLGSEWNASNLEELQRNGVGHILNVTREIDNFFPGVFDYLNVRVYDEEGTELLKHWDKTYKFIEKAKQNGSKVLVHCKMGVSRSASVVIAYAMKAYDWNMQRAFEFVKNKRNCIKPNGGFMKQLETYQGILDASKQRHNTLWRSKSETNLKSPMQDHGLSSEQHAPPSPLPLEPSLYLDVPSPSHRPKSWSPEDHIANMLFPEKLENKTKAAEDQLDGLEQAKVDGTHLRSQTDPTLDVILEAKNKHMLLPGRNGQTYSVSQNKALFLPTQALQPKALVVEDGNVTFCIGDGGDSPVYECRNPLYSVAEDTGSVLTQVTPLMRVSSVKDRINELELQVQGADQRANRDCLDLPEIRGLVLNLANQFESASKPNTPSPVDELEGIVQLPSTDSLAAPSASELDGIEHPVVSQMKPPAPRHQAVLVRPETWVDEEKGNKLSNGWEQHQESADGINQGGAVELVKQKDDLLMKLRVTGQTSSLVKPVCDENRTYNQAVRQNSSGSSTTISSPVASVDEVFAVVADVRLAIRETPSRQNSLGSNGDATKTPPPVSGRKDDPFSVHLDRVFDREERTQEHGVTDIRTQVPSRQSSWGSCDSAIVLQPPGNRESPSRQSSWGSVDSRSTFLSRESSWGSVDCRNNYTNVTRSIDPYCTIRKPSTVSQSDSLYSSSFVDPAVPPFASDESATSTVKRAKPRTVNTATPLNQSTPLKRTNSFDSSLTPQEVPSNTSPTAVNPVISPIQRSHSLRTGDRSSHSRYPLPNLKLHTPKPYRSPVDKEAPVAVLEGVADVSIPILHCSSFPSLSHTIPEGRVPGPIHSSSQPNIGTSSLPPVPSAKLRTALKLDLGIRVCQPTPSVTNIEQDDIPLSPTNDDGGVFLGIVRQQKQVLESRLASTPAVKVAPAATDERSAKEHLQYIRDLGRTVTQLPSPDIEDASLGKVKRLTKELESKTGQTPQRRNRVVIVDQQGKVIEQQCDAKGIAGQPIERSLSSPAGETSNGSSPQAGSPSSAEDSEAEKSVRLLVGKFESKDARRTRYLSENDADSRALAGIDADQSLPTRLSPGSPPFATVGGRKLSLEFDSPPKKQDTCTSSSGSPATQLKTTVNTNKPPDKPAVLGNMSTSHVIKCNGPYSSPSPKVVAFPPTSKPPPSSKSGVVGMVVADPSTVAVPPPIGGAPRKMRKLHGKSHPLNKLTLVPKQRHPNPLYNTM